MMVVLGKFAGLQDTNWVPTHSYSSTTLESQLDLASLMRSQQLMLVLSKQEATLLGSLFDQTEMEVRTVHQYPLLKAATH